MAVKAATRTLISGQESGEGEQRGRSIGEEPQGPVFSAASFTLRRVEGTVQDPALLASHARHPAPEGEQIGRAREERSSVSEIWPELW